MLDLIAVSGGDRVTVIESLAAIPIGMCVLFGTGEPCLRHERVHKALIAMDPKRPWPRGNYGRFLLERRRYDESVGAFEKAINLGPYPNALEGLEKAKKARATAQSSRR